MTPRRALSLSLFWLEEFSGSITLIPINFPHFFSLSFFQGKKKRKDGLSFSYSSRAPTSSHVQKKQNGRGDSLLHLPLPKKKKRNLMVHHQTTTQNEEGEEEESGRSRNAVDFICKSRRIFYDPLEGRKGEREREKEEIPFLFISSSSSFFIYYYKSSRRGTAT